MLLYTTAPAASVAADNHTAPADMVAADIHTAPAHSVAAVAPSATAASVDTDTHTKLNAQNLLQLSE